MFSSPVIVASNVILCGVLIIITVDIPLQNSQGPLTGPLTEGEKVKAFILAPSVYHESRSMLDIANSVLEGGIVAGDTRFLRQVFFAEDYTAPSPELSILDPDEAIFGTFATSCKLKMKEFREREACGIPLLGLFAIGVVEGLERIDKSWSLYATMEFPVVVDKLKWGVRPACDAAVVAIIDGNEKPLVLFEYKPIVDQRKDVVVRQDLIEIMIQGYYCLYQHGVSSVIHCLTDLQQFYYFKMEKAERSKMRIAWNFSVFKHDINSHLKFLYPVLKEVFLA